MELNEGDTIIFSIEGRSTRLEGRVLDEETIELETVDMGALPQEGKQISIRTGDKELRVEVVSLEGNTIRIRRILTERRECFRVDDVLPLAWRRMGKGFQYRRSRIIPEFDIEADDPNPFGSNRVSNSKLWNILVDINTKLRLIAERLGIEWEVPIKAEPKEVNISTSGIRFELNEAADIGDEFEIEMLLPTRPPTRLITYGRVVGLCGKGTEGGGCEVSLLFTDLDEAVRGEIFRYVFNRQREIIQKKRGEKETD